MTGRLDPIPGAAAQSPAQSPVQTCGSTPAKWPKPGRDSETRRIGGGMMPLAEYIQVVRDGN